VVRQKMSDHVARTLFRSAGGFELADTHPEIDRCLNSKPSSLGPSEVQLMTLFLTVLRDACIDNEENQCHVLSSKHLPRQLMTFIESAPECPDLASAAVDLLLHLSQTARNRSEIVARYDSVRLISAAFVVARRLRGSTVATNMQRLICNLAMTDQLRRQLRDDFDESVLPSFNSLLDGDQLLDVSPTAGVTLSVKTLVNLCGDSWLRSRLAASRSTWAVLVAVLGRLADRQSASEFASTILSLLANMAIGGTSGAADADLTQLSALCTDLVCRVGDTTELADRCYLVLSRVLRASDEGLRAAVDKGFVGAASRDLDHVVSERQVRGEMLSHCLAALTACTLHSDLSRRQIVDSKPPVVPVLVGLLLSHEHYDDLVIGNAALCLSHCISLPSAVRQLTKAVAGSEIIMTLLVLARDQAKPTVQHNCAILIAKLVQQHAPFLDQLRELHGLEILHTVLRHVEH